MNENDPYVMKKRTGWVIVTGWDARRVKGTEAYETKEAAERELRRLKGEQHGGITFRWTDNVR